MVQLNVLEKQRFRYAAGFVIQQEGPDVVERLVRDGSKSRFGVRENWVPGQKLENLTREDAEEVLENREWKFYGYHEIQDLTIPAKIFDVHITFEFEPAIELAQEALDLEKSGRLDFQTRSKIEEVQSQDFFTDYILELEDFVENKYDGRSSLLRRVQRIPYRNIDSNATFL